MWIKYISLSLREVTLDLEAGVKYPIISMILCNTKDTWQERHTCVVMQKDVYLTPRLIQTK